MIVAVTLLCACGTSTKEALTSVRNDWENEHLNGMVKTMEEMEFTPDSLGNISEMDSCCLTIFQYDEKGFESSLTEKDISGVITFRSVFERTEGGLLVSSTDTKDGKQDGGREVTRDAEGKFIYGMHADAAGNMKYFFTEIKENEFGQAISGKMYSPDSSLIGTWGRHYVDGLPAGRSWSGSDGKLIHDYKGEVNAQGHLSKMTATVAAGDDSTITFVTTFVYDSFDEAGNWTQRTEIDEDGKVKEVKKRMYTYFKETR